MKTIKKTLALLVALSFIPTAYAIDTANIKIKISGALNENNYFLCLRNVGCMSLLAAKKGKVFPLRQPIPIGNIYITDVNDMGVYPQGRPTSCNVTVQPNQTITISGKLKTGQEVKVDQLHCVVS